MVGTEKKIRKLRKFIKLYEASPKMTLQVDQARLELAGHERQFAWLKSKIGVLPKDD